MKFGVGSWWGCGNGGYVCPSSMIPFDGFGGAVAGSGGVEVSVSASFHLRRDGPVGRFRGMGQAVGAG